jgi:succinoglycan biosynthesis transport protein ExoP
MDAPFKFAKPAGAQAEAPRPGDTISITELIEQLTGFVRRQSPIFIFVSACCLALGMVYLFTTPPSFTSHSMLLIDSSKLRILQQQQTPVGDTPIDTAQVETQVEILKSENIGLAVVRDLKLTEDPEFAGAGSGLLGWILGRVVGSGDASETKLERRALATFLGKRSIARVGRTYVLDISFTSLDATRSAALANAIGDAYIVDQLEAKYQATKRASTWLQDRIKELRQQASDADRAVLDYKEKNKIVSVGVRDSSGGSGRLLGEQQLEDLNTQLGSARASAEDAKARLERISDVMQRDVPDAAVADSLHSEVINRLRNNYLDLAAKEAIWSARYGSSHLAAVNLRTQMAELRRSIHDELGRIAESYKSDYEIGKSRVEGLERELQKLVASSQVTNRDRLGLTDLESTAKVYHSIYDNFLQRYMEAIQQQSFPITEARIISTAAPPERKSSPLLLPVLGVALLVGIILSFGAAILREAIDQVFRTSRHVENTLGVSCLAVLPLLGSASIVPKGGESKPISVKPVEMMKRAPAGKDPRPVGSSGKDPRPVASSLAAARTAGEQEGAGRAGVSHLVASILGQEAPLAASAHEVMEAKRLRFPRDRFMRQVVDEPLSPFAEAFRSIKVAADVGGAGKSSKVIGIISTLPGEGKSTVSSNFAELIASSGKRVILVDGDLRNPTITRTLAPHSKAGLLEVLNNEMTLNDVICTDEQTRLNFVPAVIRSRIAHTVEILASAAFESFVDNLRKTYDYVIIDFPPLAPVVDVRATTQVVDSYIYVVEWGKTHRNLVQRQLQAAPEIYDNLLGVVLNKANVNVMQRYEDYYGHYYHRKYYGAYGYSA